MNQDILKQTEEKMKKTLENLNQKFLTIRAGRANPSTLDKVMVSYYGAPTPLKQLATISVPEARLLLIKPYDRTTIPAIEKAIYEANLGYTPGNDGEAVRITIPVLTEERRVEYVKQAKAMAEEERVALRNIRRDAMDLIKKNEASEDEEKQLNNKVQDLINEYNKKIDEKYKEKEKELMSI